MAKERKRKSRLPFRKTNGDVIWTLTDGEEVVVSWEEFKKMVKSKEYVALPRKEFESYYKRMKMPKDAREYHKKAKRKKKNESSRR